jgi:hypothetical protein
MKVEGQSSENGKDTTPPIATKATVVVFDNPDTAKGIKFRKASSSGTSTVAVSLNQPLNIEIPTAAANRASPRSSDGGTNLLADAHRQKLPSLSNRRSPMSVGHGSLVATTPAVCGAAPTTVAERFVQQQLRSKNLAANVQLHKKAPQHRRLRKYASETSFSSTASAGSSRLLPSRDPLGSSCQTESLQPLATATSLGQEGENEILMFSRMLRARSPQPGQVTAVSNQSPLSVAIPFGTTTATRFTPYNGGGNVVAATAPSGVATKVQRKRQDSDDASVSLGSGSTVGSVQMTPQTHRKMMAAQQRQKLRRPKSTGNMLTQETSPQTTPQDRNSIPQDRNSMPLSGAGGHFVFVPDGSARVQQRNRNSSNTVLSSSNNNNNNNVNAYDPSYTSATIHSLESLNNTQPLVMIGHPDANSEDRRPSNYYLFEDDSTHEFDDEGKQSFICFILFKFNGLIYMYCG